MKITIDRNIIEVLPENTQEISSLETLWRILIDCVGESKKLTPIGEYIPGKNNLARFTIEGVDGGKTALSEQKSLDDGTYICTTCNK
jgi:hypothetical protein